ncbi:hypothetical protein AALO_G00144950 [Alosa alosa]|uniref:Uncharacterized protein n=1 Tax=Alosa alosa TaxID=278164 RepID=A0AAV6GJ18_9TELE|nr:hypothetical protein AALO_G00144950 [Alosa alosa]
MIKMHIRQVSALTEITQRWNKAKSSENPEIPAILTKDSAATNCPAVCMLTSLRQALLLKKVYVLVVWFVQQTTTKRTFSYHTQCAASLCY